MREDIIAGLKNAFERGESMEKAVQAFISAGYNQVEVEEAAKSLSSSQTQQKQATQPTGKKMRGDIVTGLKNTFERGESMEKAVQAFISAGYNQVEVEEAAKSLGFSYSQQEQTTSSAPLKPVQQQTQEKTQFQPLPKSPSLIQDIPIPNAPSTLNNSEKPGSTGKFKVLNILLGVVGALLVLSIIGFVVWKFLKGG